MNLLKKLKETNIFITSLKEEDGKVTVNCADTYADWREVLPKQINSGNTEGDFKAYITSGYVAKQKRWCKLQLMLCGVLEENIQIIWNPKHLSDG